jgi:flagellar biosynthesis protein FliQ
MTESMIFTIGRDALMTAFMLSVPLLGVSLIVGLVISIFQAVTQINEMTLTFVPKLIGLGAVLLILGPWMLEKILSYTADLFEMLPYMVR